MYVCLGFCLQWWAAHYRITTSMLDHIFKLSIPKSSLIIIIIINTKNVNNIDICFVIGIPITFSLYSPNNKPVIFYYSLIGSLSFDTFHLQCLRVCMYVGIDMAFLPVYVHVYISTLCVYLTCAGAFKGNWPLCTKHIFQ